MACSEFGSEYKGCTVECWWCTFWSKNAFPHPKGQEADTSMYWQKLPPFFQDNPNLHCKFVKYCVSNLQDLMITLARDYVCKKLIPAAMKKHEVIVNDDTLELQQNAEQWDLLKDLYGISKLPGHTTIYDWLVKCGFQYKAWKKCILLINMCQTQTITTESCKCSDTCNMNVECTTGFRCHSQGQKQWKRLEL